MQNINIRTDCMFFTMRSVNFY